MTNKGRDRKTEYEIISDLLTEIKDEWTEELNTKDPLIRYSNILLAERALDRIKDNSQSVENFVNSLQENFKKEE